MDQSAGAVGALVRSPSAAYQLARLHSVPRLLRLVARLRRSLPGAAKQSALLWFERPRPAALVLVRPAALAGDRRRQPPIRLGSVARFSRLWRPLAHRVSPEDQSQGRLASFRTEFLLTPRPTLSATLANDGAARTAGV